MDGNYILELNVYRITVYNNWRHSVSRMQGNPILHSFISMPSMGAPRTHLPSFVVYENWEWDA